MMGRASKVIQDEHDTEGKNADASGAAEYAKVRPLQ
jgi:hypothetical protein